VSEPRNQHGAIRIRRADFPLHTQASGMAAQADMWLLQQIEANEMTGPEALRIVSHMLATVATLIERDAAREALEQAGEPPF
jgi:hypothetical protein